MGLGATGREAEVSSAGNKLPPAEHALLKAAKAQQGGGGGRDGGKFHVVECYFAAGQGTPNFHSI